MGSRLRCSQEVCHALQTQQVHGLVENIGLLRLKHFSKHNFWAKKLTATEAKV
jgi:hypothetical protein